VLRLDMKMDVARACPASYTQERVWCYSVADLDVRCRRVEKLEDAAVPQLHGDGAPRTIAGLHHDAVDAGLEVQGLRWLALRRPRREVHPLVDPGGLVLF